jgi:Icc protein
VKRLVLFAAAIFGAILLQPGSNAQPPGGLRFIIVGDRTGEAQAGVWERVWREVSAAAPDFVIGVGDVIQGTDDNTAAAQWREYGRMMTPYRKIPFYLAPGNHDVWSAMSAELFVKNTGRPLHYSFDRGGAHFTVLDNSRGEEDTAFLEDDLRAHEGAALKFVIAHRPSWIMDAALANPAGQMHQIAKRYGVRYFIAGHIHQLIHATYDGVTYFSVPSAGGHLRLSGKYEDGWFFGWTQVTVHGNAAAFAIHDLEGHTTALEDWTRAGLAVRAGK